MNEAFKKLLPLITTIMMSWPTCGGSGASSTYSGARRLRQLSPGRSSMAANQSPKALSRRRGAPCLAAPTALLICHRQIVWSGFSTATLFGGDPICVLFQVNSVNLILLNENQSTHLCGRGKLSPPILGAHQVYTSTSSKS